MPTLPSNLSDATIERLVDALAASTQAGGADRASRRDPASVFAEARRVLEEREATARTEATTVGPLLDRLRAELPAVPQARVWLVGAPGAWSLGRFVLRNRGPTRASFTFHPDAPLDARFRPSRISLQPWEDAEIDLEARMPDGEVGEVLRRVVVVQADGRDALTLWVDLEVERAPRTEPP